MDPLDYLTAQNVAVAERLRALPLHPRRGSLSLRQVLVAAAPDAIPDMTFEAHDGLLATLASDDGRWTLLRLDYRVDRRVRFSSEAIGWDRLGDRDRVNGVLVAYLNREEAESAIGLLDRILRTRDRYSLWGKKWWPRNADTATSSGGVPVSCYAAGLILASSHPGARAAQTLWHLGGFGPLREFCTAEGFDPATDTDGYTRLGE